MSDEKLHRVGGAINTRVKRLTASRAHSHTSGSASRCQPDEHCDHASVNHAARPCYSRTANLIL